jgi:Ca2+-binding RTX toxin-like protein
VEGGGDTDTVAFDGDDVGEHFDLSANGSRVRLSRDVAAITMDLDDVESVRVRGLGGADAITQHDLSGTDLVEVTADLSASDGVSGDGQPDTVTVEGTNGDDVPRVVGDVNGVAVVGLAARMNVLHSEAANDALHVNALAGDDVVDGSSLLAGALTLTGDGGDGDDVLIGGAGADILLGQAGDDVLFGGPGFDALDGGPGSTSSFKTEPPFGTGAGPG